MMRLVSAIMARNEAAPDRYLARVIQRCREFSDTVLLLDDRSTDDTAKLAADLGCEVRGRSILQEAAWGHEAPARSELWDWAAEVAGDGWVLINDADQLLHGDPRPLCLSWEVNAWAWPLFDCWDSEQQFRADGYWQGYQHPRVWMVRPTLVPDDWKPVWGNRGLHSGHIPPNFPLVAGIAPDDIYWLHYGWLREEDRLAKYERYKSQSAHLTPHELAHVESIVT